MEIRESINIDRLENAIKSQIEEGEKIRIYQLFDRCVKNINDVGRILRLKKSHVV